MEGGESGASQMSSAGTHALAHLGTAMLYALHVTLDAHTPPAPAPQPPAPSIQIKIAVSGRISPQGPAPAASARGGNKPHRLHRETERGGAARVRDRARASGNHLAVTAAERAWGSEKADRGRADGR
jgi:hypothetical protein